MRLKHFQITIKVNNLEQFIYESNKTEIAQMIQDISRDPFSYIRNKLKVLHPYLVDVYVYSIFNPTKKKTLLSHRSFVMKDEANTAFSIEYTHFSKVKNNFPIRFSGEIKDGKSLKLNIPLMDF